MAGEAEHAFSRKHQGGSTDPIARFVATAAGGPSFSNGHFMNKALLPSVPDRSCDYPSGQRFSTDSNALQMTRFALNLQVRVIGNAGRVGVMAGPARDCFLAVVRVAVGTGMTLETGE